jgi:hypothetical protein
MRGVFSSVKFSRWILVGLLGWLVFCLVSCSAEKQLARIIKKHPELVQVDTARDTVEVIIPEIDIDTLFQMSDDVSGVDSILSTFGDKIDSLRALKLGSEIKYYISNRNVLEDTVFYAEDGVFVKVWQEGNGLRFKINKPQEIIREPVAIPYDKIVMPEEETKWWEWLLAAFILYLVIKEIASWISKRHSSR